MSEPAITVENLGKQYRIGARVGPRRSLWDSFLDQVRTPWRKARSLMRGQAYAAAGLEETIWALRDVSFEVQPGEVVGIIGRNGAGKSTLLKILARITEPTEGRAELRGRLGSLLEVGTGFHPELTGRENSFLNGAILGMRKAEIDRKFDEIVEFSGVGKFIDTPVKHYSSGMYVRLAFAVAANLETEILLVDEVLAVGDAAFQRRSQRKMRASSDEGRTILFVSHNMGAVRALCDRALWIEDGGILRSGPTAEIVEDYLAQSATAESTDDIPTIIAALPPDPAFRLLEARVSQNGKSGTDVFASAPVRIEMTYEVYEPTAGLRVYFDLCDEDQNILIQSFHDGAAEEVPLMSPGRYTSVAEIPAGLLAPRDYILVFRAGIHNVRSCTGDGARVFLRVGRGAGAKGAYHGDTIRARLCPTIDWSTVQRSGPC